uniref:Uncharacterized protein n=1 Tax=Globodera pallida TaxID=36090 RepID=A0A183CJM6_GLOPA
MPGSTTIIYTQNWLPPRPTNYDNNANVGGQANRTQIAGVERVLFSLDQMSVLTDCVAGVQHQQQLLDQALNDRELHQLLLVSVFIFC